MKHQRAIVLFITVHSVITSVEITAFHSQCKVFTTHSRFQTSRNALINNSNIDERLSTSRTDKAPFFVTNNDPQNEISSENFASHDFHFSFDEAKNSVAFQMLYQIMCPIFGREIKKGVAKNDIKGAWLSTAFTFLLAGCDPVLSAIAATFIAYVAITPGIAGDVVRVTGKASWSLLNNTRIFISRINIKSSHTTQKSITTPVLTDFVQEVKHDDSVVKFVEDVECIVKEAEKMLQQGNPVSLDPAEIHRLQVEARAAELEYLLDEAKIDKEIRLAEKEFQEEKLRLQEEIEAAERMALEQRLEDTSGQSSKDFEDAALASDDNHNTGNTTEGYDDDDDQEDYIDGEEWEAMIKIAEELNDEEVNENNDWSSARELAKDLAVESIKNDNNRIDINDPTMAEKQRMELIGKAARAAVEKFENERNKRKITNSFSEIQRRLVQAELNNMGNKLEAKESDEESDYSKMTVVQLKEILRSKGLKVSGKKAELIERLISS